MGNDGRRHGNRKPPYRYTCNHEHTRRPGKAVQNLKNALRAYGLALFGRSRAYTQLFNLLCDKADDVYGGRLPVHVRCLLDEFANIGQIPKFEKLIATIRSREISASIILQSQSQLKAIYKDNADTIVGNCDTTLFLGGKEKTTLKEMSEILGKETIDSFNTSETRGRELSHGLNYQKLGKDMPYLLMKSSAALNLT